MSKPHHEQYNGALTIDQIVQGVEAAVENADELIKDAKLLFDKERYARAFSLCVLAEEETAKVVLLMGSITMSRNPKGWKSFWKMFRSHSSKYVQSVWLDSMLIENDEEIKKHFQGPRELAYYVNVLKQMGFYTDFESTNQRFLKPQEIISKQFAENIITMATGRLNFIKQFRNKDLLLSSAKKLSNIIEELEREDPTILDNPFVYAEKLLAKMGINLGKV